MIEIFHKILVIKLRAIGDVVLSTVVLPSLRKAYKDAEIHFLVEEPGRDVLEGNPYIDRIVVLPRKEWESMPAFKAWKASFRFLKTLRRERYDLVLDLFGNPRSAFITWTTGALCRVGYAFRMRKHLYNRQVKPRGDQVHEAEFNLDALHALDIPVVATEPCFPILNENREFAERFITENNLDGSFIVGFHVWGSWEAKRWGLERFADLADLLVESFGANIIILWGPGEREFAERVKDLAHYPVILAPETTLKELGALLSRCQLVVANDSGPMHIAAAVGVPTVGIFGPTNWRLQGPFGGKNRAVYKKGLSCLGCNRLTCQELTCMNDLSVNEVMDVVRSIIDQENILKKVVKSDVH